MAITITEALAEIKTVGKRIEKKREFIKAFLARQDGVKDPLEKDGGSFQAIARDSEIQAGSMGANSLAEQGIAGIKPGPSDAQLTKTPSADHDAGNLRGLAEPNHQPHAVSQGWRTDLENAPGGVRFLIAGRYPNGIWYVEESYRHYAGHFNGRKIDPPTHWMPLPAPPSPAKTGGAEG